MVGIYANTNNQTHLDDSAGGDEIESDVLAAGCERGRYQIPVVIDLSGGGSPHGVLLCTIHTRYIEHRICF